MSDEYKFMDMEIVGNIKNEEEEFENQIQPDQIINVNDGFVLLENYFS